MSYEEGACHMTLPHVHARNLVAIWVGLAVGDDVELACRVGFGRQRSLAQYQSCQTHMWRRTHVI